MATLERPVDRGTRLGRAAMVRVGQQIREARQDRGLSIKAVAAATGLSAAEVSRIERGLVPGVSLLTLARISAVVGLDLVVRQYPGPRPIRDAAQAGCVGDLRAVLHRSIQWAAEVPMPIPGDQRAWDGVISGSRELREGPRSRDGSRWRYGVEVETSPRDLQALLRRNQLKLRDSGLDGFLIVMPGTRHARAFVRAASGELTLACPVPGKRALELLHAGIDPGGNAVILLPRHRRAGLDETRPRQSPVSREAGHPASP